MNMLHALLAVALLLTEVPSNCSGYSFLIQNQGNGVVQGHGGGTVSISTSHSVHSQGIASGGSTFTGHSYQSGSPIFSSVSGSNHAFVQHPLFEGRPESIGSPPNEPSAAQSVTSNEPISKTAVPVLASKSIVDVIVDAIAFADDGVRSQARRKISDCIVNSNLADDMLIDQDVFREFFNWELTFWNCYINADQCTVGWNVVPASLMGVSMDYVQGLSMDVHQADYNTFKEQKWMVTRMIEVACISYIEKRKPFWNGKLKELVESDYDLEQQRRDVERFFSTVKMTSMVTALHDREHVCFPASEKEDIIGMVRDAAFHFDIDCYTTLGMNQERDPALPPARRASLRSPPTRTGQQGPAPGT